MKLWLISAIAGLLLLSSVGITAEPAQASDNDADLSNASQIVSAVAPGIVDPGQGVAPTGSEDAVRVQGSAQSTSIDVPAPDSVAHDLTIGLKSALGTKSTSGQFTVVNDRGSNHAQYVQPLPNGVRMITAISSPTSPARFSYTFDFGVDVTTTTNQDGSIFIENSHGEPIGTVAAPWAIDASGALLQTKYEWSGNVLTQTVDLSTVRNIEYPVLADPAFTYNLVYTLGKTSAFAVWKELHRCFNCSFPIDGAPRIYPHVGQILPLTVPAVGNFKCKFSNSYNNINREEAGFQFVAQPGHVDGSGSVISFDFFKRYTDNNVVLSVSASILNSPFTKDIYVSIVVQVWGQFASNLINNLHLPIPANTPPVPPK